MSSFTILVAFLLLVAINQTKLSQPPDQPRPNAYSTVKHFMSICMLLTSCFPKNSSERFTPGVRSASYLDHGTTLRWSSRKRNAKLFGFSNRSKIAKEFTTWRIYFLKSICIPRSFMDHCSFRNAWYSRTIESNRSGKSLTCGVWWRKVSRRVAIQCGMSSTTSRCTRIRTKALSFNVVMSSRGL